MFGRVINIVLDVDTARHASILREAPQKQAHNKIDLTYRDSVNVTHSSVKMTSVARHRLAKLSRNLVHRTLSKNSSAYSNLSDSHATFTSEGFRSTTVADSSLHTPMDPIMGADPPVRRYILVSARMCICAAGMATEIDASSSIPFLCMQR